MSQYQNPYDPNQGQSDLGALQARYAEVVADTSVDERIAFLRKTYMHLFGAVLAIVAIQAMVFTFVPEATLVQTLGFALSGFNWLIVLALFMLVSTVAHKWAHSAVSPQVQYLGLGVYVLAQSAILVPLLAVAQIGFPDQNIIGTAGIATMLIFAVLTTFVFATRADLSFMGGVLTILAMAAMALIVCSILFGFQLGIIFIVAMVALASGFILYETSNVLHHYRVGQHVAASLGLLGALVLLFWYVLQLAMYFAAER